MESRSVDRRTFAACGFGPNHELPNPVLPLRAAAALAKKRRSAKAPPWLIAGQLLQTTDSADILACLLTLGAGPLRASQACISQRALDSSSCT